jgi:hypothetical protein
VTLFIDGTAARTGGAPTYNSVTMTDSGAGFVFNDPGECGVEVWYLLSPDTGSSYAVNVPNSGALLFDISVTSWIPSVGGAAFDAQNSGTGTTQNPSITVTTGNANDLMVGALGSGDRDAPTAGTNYTLIHTRDIGNQTWGTEYDLDTGGSGGVTVDFGTARADDWGLIGVAFNEEVTDPAPNVSDDATATDAVTVAISAPQISVQDDATATDSATTAVVTSPLSVNVSDDATATDSVTTTIVFLGEYRKEIVVDNTEVTASLTDFPILLSLSSDSNLASRASKNGEDIYITKADGVTQIPHEIEHYDPSTGGLVLWFKGDLSTSEDTTFYMYYGRTEAADDAAGSVWDANHGGVYHMDTPIDSLAIAQNGISQGLHPQIISPQAYYYNGVTYVAWQGGSGLDPYVAAYVHASKTWLGPVQAGTNPLSGDDHGAPSIVVDNSGDIHLFFGSHNSAIKHTKSTNAEDISAWTAQSDLPSGTYPNSIKADDGTIYVFYRAGGASPYTYTYVTSSDYSTETDIIDSTSDHVPYVVTAYDGANERIHLAWYINNGAGSWFDICHAYLDLGDDHLYTMAGTDLGISISEAEMDANCIIVNSGSDQTWIPALQLDGSNNPHIVYPIEDTSNQKYQYIYWTGSAWSTPDDITTFAGNVDTLANFYITDGGDLEAYLTISASGASRGGTLEHWRLTGGNWSFVRTIMPLDSRPFYPPSVGPNAFGWGNPNIIANGTDDLRVICASIDVNVYSHQTLEIFALNVDDNFIDRDLTISGSTARQYDSTSNLKHAANAGGVTVKDGKVHQGAEFDGSSVRYDPNVEPGATGITVELWADADAFAAGANDVYSQGNTGDNDPFVRCMIRDYDASDGEGLIERVGFYHRTDATANYQVYGRTTLLTGTWYHLVWSYSAANSIAMYVNGQAETLSTVQNDDVSGATTINTDQIGALARIAFSNYFDGDLDEVRISDTARSADWIETSYNNQNTPGTFITLGPELLPILISAQDDAAATDSATVSINDPDVSVQDDATATDSAIVSIEAGAADHEVNVSDDATATDTVSANISDPAISVQDDVTATDSTTVAIGGLPDLSVNVQDNATARSYLFQFDEQAIATDSVTAAVIDEGTKSVDVSDDATATDAVTVAISDPAVAVQDDATATDSATVSIAAVGLLEVNVSDDATATDSAAADVSDPDVSVQDDATATDTATAAVSDPQVIVSDDATAIDSVTVAIAAVGLIEVNISDDATATDSATVIVSDPQISVQDDATATDSVTVALPEVGVVEVNVSDDATATDSVTLIVSDPQVIASDDATATDNVTVALPLFVSVQDDATATDTISVALASQISISDSATATDALTVDPLVIDLVYTDNATATDSISVAIPGYLVTGDPDRTAYVLFKDRRAYVAFKDRRSFVVYKDKRTVV